MAEDDGSLGIITLVAAVTSTVKIIREIIVPTSGDNTMVAIPSDMELYVLIAAVGFAVFFGIATYLWRYAEHNDKHGENRQTNKLFGKGGVKFIGAEMFAIALTTVVAYYGAAVAPGRLGIAEPELLDYLLVASFISIFLAILTTILFNEGISGLGKFLRQKAGEVTEAAEGMSAAVLEVKEAAEKLAKELGLSKKKAKAYVDSKVEEAKIAEAEKAAAAPLEGAQ